MGTVSLVTTLLEVHTRSSFQQRQGTPPYTSSQEAVTIEMADLRVDMCSLGEAKRINYNKFCNFLNMQQLIIPAPLCVFSLF